MKRRAQNRHKSESPTRYYADYSLSFLFRATHEKPLPRAVGWQPNSLSGRLKKHDFIETHKKNDKYLLSAQRSAGLPPPFPVKK